MRNLPFIANSAAFVGAQFIASSPYNSTSNTGFSTDDSIRLPKRDAAIPNPQGTQAVFKQSQYSIENDKTYNSIWLLDIEPTGSNLMDAAHLLVNDSNANSPFWLDESTVLYQSTAEDGSADSLFVINTDGTNNYLLSNITKPIKNFKIRPVSDSTFNIVIAASAGPEGQIAPEEGVKSPWAPSDANIYDSIYIRHWDYWLTLSRNNLFGAQIVKKGDKWTLNSGSLVNLLHNAKSVLESPVPPFGGSGDFSISEDKVAFLSKAPNLPRANHTASYIYLTSISGDTQPVAINPSKGASSYPSFSPTGQYIAYSQMDTDGYESDQAKLYVYDAITQKTKAYLSGWPYSVQLAKWSDDSKTLYFSAEVEGYVSLFSINVDNSETIPKRIFEKKDGSVSAWHKICGQEKFLVTSDNFEQNAIYTLVDATGSTTNVRLWESPELKNKFPPTEEFTFDCTEGDKCHGFIVKPIGFDENKKYPISFLIHGGPQDAWTNSWSTRWNPALFANAANGFIAVIVNFSGSSGYGQKFVDKIAKNWGGYPYQDLVMGFDYVVENYKYMDENNAAAAGASYGGYMVNWISGNDFADKFKALVTHDGVFNTKSVYYSTEEIWFPTHDFGGAPWEVPETYEKWNPERLVNNWHTPHLIVHNTKDYRLTEAEGLSAFNTLQIKGVPSRMLNFPSENHWVLQPKNFRVWSNEVLGWMVKWTSK